MKKAFKNTRVQVGLVVILFIITFFAISYGAFFTYRVQSDDNVILSGCFSTTFTNESASISLQKALPMSDQEGLATTPYTFKITNTCNINSDYYVILSSTTGSIASSNIKYQFNSDEPAVLGNAPLNTLGVDSGYTDSRIIGSGYIKAGKNITVNVRLWINPDANYSQIHGQSWTGQIKIVNKATSAKQLLADTIIAKYGTDANLYYHTTDTTKYSNGEDEISSTEPTDSTTETYANLNAGDGSYRYSGANPNNYICFGTSSESECLNDISNNGTSKYLYRIIGVFDDGNGNYVTKIVLANPLYNSATSAATYRWDYIGTSTSGTYSNKWASASLKQWLNGEILKSGAENYYPTSTFLSNYTSTWTNKILPSTWYVRGFTDRTLNAKGIYTDEIANVKNGVIGYTTNYQGNSATLTNTKVGLMYISDYMYGASPSYWNYPGYSSSGATYDYRAASSNNWLFTGVITWSVSPYASSSNNAWYVTAAGLVSTSSYLFVNSARAVEPVINLSSDIEIDTSATSADGSADHPYILKAE